MILPLCASSYVRLDLNKIIWQFIRPTLEPADRTRVEFVAMQEREGDKHTIHIGRARWMRTLLLQTGVA